MELTKEQVKTLKAVAKFAATDKDGMAALTHVRVETIDGKTTFVATDRFGIAFFTLNNTTPADTYELYYIPAKVLASIPLKATEITYNEADALLSVGGVMYPINKEINYPHVDQLRPSGEPIAGDSRMSTDLLKRLGNFPDSLDVSVKEHGKTPVFCAERHTEDSSVNIIIMPRRKVN